MSPMTAYLAGPIVALAAAMACYFGIVSLVPRLDGSAWLRVPVIMVAMGLAFGLTPLLIRQVRPGAGKNE